MQSVLPCNIPDVANRLNVCRDARLVRPFQKMYDIRLQIALSGRTSRASLQLLLAPVLA